MVASIAVGAAVSVALNHFLPWPGVRYFVYRALQKSESRRIRQPEQTTLVVIDNDEYYTQLDHRMPLRRDYLARLLKEIVKCDPAVIAVDVVFPAIDPAGRPLRDSYSEETRQLRDVLVDLPRNTTIVLPVGLIETSNGLRRQPTLFDDLQQLPNIRFGFTRLAENPIQVATTVRTIDSDEPLDSFSLAITRAANRKLSRQIAAIPEFPFSSFLEPRLFEDVRIRAADIMAGDAAAIAKLNRAAHKIVILGGEFVDSAGRRDVHQTVVGEMSGIVLVANYVEALLSRSTRAVVPKWLEILIEVAAGFTIAGVLFVRTARNRLRLVLVLAVLILVVPLLAWQNFGFFFDSVPTMLVLSLHAAFEGWREDRHAAGRPAWSDARTVTVAILIGFLGIALIMLQLKRDALRLGPSSTQIAALLNVLRLDKNLSVVFSKENDDERWFAGYLGFRYPRLDDDDRLMNLAAWQHVRTSRESPLWKLPSIEITNGKLPAGSRAYIDNVAAILSREPTTSAIIVEYHADSSERTDRAELVRQELVRARIARDRIAVLARAVGQETDRVDLWLLKPEGDLSGVIQILSR